MNKIKLINQIKALLSIEVKLEQMKLDDGMTIIEAEVFEADAEVFIVNGEERVALPIGEYTLEDGRILVVTVDGIIAEIKDAPVEDAPVEDAPVEDAVAPELAAPTAIKKIVESISKEMFFEEMAKLNARIDGLQLAKVEPVELAVHPIIPNPESIVDKKVVSLYSHKNAKTMQDIVFEKINKFKNK